MFAKVFSQIFDSSIADDPGLRHFFMDMLLLADVNGVVDMTQNAIAARTRIPLEDVKVYLAKLEAPDPESRSPEANGARIERLDDHRTWGWEIVNYTRFRLTASEEQRREKTRLRTRKYRAKPVSEMGDASVTHGNASDGMERQKETETHKEKESPSSYKYSETQEISFRHQLKAIAKELDSLQAKQNGGWDLTEAQKAERKKLKKARLEILEKTGWPA